MPSTAVKPLPSFVDSTSPPAGHFTAFINSFIHCLFAAALCLLQLFFNN